MKLKKDEAVSPVIATILLVAIVVVLVAIIAAVVLPMSGNIETTKSVSVVVTLNGAGTLPVMTIIGGQDADSLKNVTVYVSGTVDEAVIAQTNPIVGKPYTATKTPESGKQTVSVVGEFTDGTTQTLYTGSMVFNE